MRHKDSMADMRSANKNSRLGLVVFFEFAIVLCAICWYVAKELSFFPLFVCFVSMVRRAYGAYVVNELHARERDPIERLISWESCATLLQT